jgi:hypothetical protein
MMLIVNGTDFLLNVQKRAKVTIYAAGSVLCVQGGDAYGVRNACRMICCFLEDIRSVSFIKYLAAVIFRNLFYKNNYKRLIFLLLRKS